MACLETDFLIALIRKDKCALEKLKNLLDVGERITTTPLNAAELFKGAYLSEKVAENLITIKGILNRLELLNFSYKAAEYYGKIFADLKERGLLIGDVDILVASIVLASDEQLLTRNIKHYERVTGLKLLEW